MARLPDYKYFAGTHWETGSIINALAYQGVKAPHTGLPYTEALFLGVSGGVVMGYFTFAYKGIDPQVRILTRNTFDPWDTMLSRMGVVQHVQHTSKPERGIQNLVNALEEGHAPVVWADIFSLPYNVFEDGLGMWAMFPHVVFGFDEGADVAHIADRAPVPLVTQASELQTARARVKKHKFRLITLEPPNPDKLATAVQLGIQDTINLYTEQPPKGSANNFGFKAYDWWIEQLNNPHARISWEKQFPAGREMLAGLSSAYGDIIHFGKRDDPADRGKFAGFLDEAATILERPALTEGAGLFREAAKAWGVLAKALLPDEIEPFGEFRRAMDRSHKLFTEKGAESTEERRQLARQQGSILSDMGREFPLDDHGVKSLRDNIATQIQTVRDIENKAITSLKNSMA